MILTSWPSETAVSASLELKAAGSAFLMPAGIVRTNGAQNGKRRVETHGEELTSGSRDPLLGVGLDQVGLVRSDGGHELQQHMVKEWVHLP